MEIPIWVVDAFADGAFHGNPAGIVISEVEIPADQMQSIAMEMKHAETAFLRPCDGGYRLRWFTPTAEVELCGHATLASAHILYQLAKVTDDLPIHFHTLSGILTARKVGEEIQLDFPAVPVLAKPLPPFDLEAALGASMVFAGPTKMDILVELESEDDVLKLNPDLRRLAEFETRGFIVTARSNRPNVDFVSRFFAPRFGVDEDPVTGSAHCTLAQYWGEKLGCTEMNGFQASQRGGRVKVVLDGDRVMLLGKARTFLAGEIYL